MKKICCIFLIISVFFCLTGVVSGAYGTEYSWYIKRNGKLRPLMQSEQELIYKYNGYFIDKKLTDESEEKKIYLTFDAGYENGNTERILDTLKEEGITAAFFVLDNIILKNSDLVKRMKDEGHLVCNHTKSHRNLSRLSEEEIKKDLLSLEKIYEDTLGYKMDKFFRFPEGRYSEYALRCVDSLGYKSIFWSFAYDDWDNNRQMNKEKAINKVISNTHNGAVMLFHPTSKTNADIFPTLIKEWKNMGYSFGTLYDLVK